jgi:hypothetical protein
MDNELINILIKNKFLYEYELRLLDPNGHNPYFIRDTINVKKYKSNG